jgi:hypothetical protein
MVAHSAVLPGEVLCGFNDVRAIDTDHFIIFGIQILSRG